MKRNVKSFIIGAILFVLFCILILLLKIVDVKEVGPNDSIVGLASINQYIHNLIGVHMLWYHITDWLGLAPILLAFCFGMLGFIELVARRSIKKVDVSIIILGIYYIIVIFLYFFFEMVIVNCRPILMDGYLETSFPSSHTFVTISIMTSAVIVCNSLTKNKVSRKIMFIMAIAIIFVTVFGRLLSGVHWFTDILGGLFLSCSLTFLFDGVIETIKVN